MRKSGLRELWRERVKAFWTSGLSGTAWCAREDVSRAQLHCSHTAIFFYTIRPVVIGRKNWLFANTPEGARASAG
jgi:hypothetical protein